MNGNAKGRGMRPAIILSSLMLVAACAQVRGGNENSVTVQSSYSQFGGTQKAYDEAGAWCAKYGRTAKFTTQVENRLTFECIK
jgi:hypothetical protein